MGDWWPAGKVDATEETELKARLNVEGFPTLLFARNGEKWQELSGVREVDGFVRFAKRMARAAVLAVKNEAELRSFQAGQPVCFLLCDSTEAGKSVLAPVTEAAARNQHILVRLAPRHVFRAAADQCDSPVCSPLHPRRIAKCVHPSPSSLRRSSLNWRKTSRRSCTSPPSGRQTPSAT